MGENPPEDPVEDSILDSIKLLCKVPHDYDAYDAELLMHINSAFGDLTDLGVGPEAGFEIDGPDVLWIDYLEGTDFSLNRVKTYVGLKVRLAFDPPTSGYQITAIEKQIAALDWKINNHREAKKWVPPTESDRIL